jgi:GTP-binding protein
MTLEMALEFIEDDELVEKTPLNIRLRKAILKEKDRKRFSARPDPGGRIEFVDFIPMFM